MATVENRSRFVVTVKNNDKLTRYFPYNKLEAVEAYMKELRARREKYKPKVDQLDESWLVLIRQTGYPKLERTFSNEATAEAFVKKVEAERAQKIFIDYAKSFTRPSPSCWCATCATKRLARKARRAEPSLVSRHLDSSDFRPGASWGSISDGVNPTHSPVRYESPRVFRRLKSLRGLSHEEVEQVLTRGA